MTDHGPITHYLGMMGIATALGVTLGAVQRWVTRYPPGSRHPFPLPDVMIGNRPGWSPDRLPEIRAWREEMPGRGAGGGRPRKDRSRT